MAIEIERKFVVRGHAWREQVERSIPMHQGYLQAASAIHGGGKASVRVRLEGDEARLNIKAAQAGAARAEFEYPIPLADAHALLDLCVSSRIDKTRHLVRHAGHLWEIDEFHGENTGLVIAEVELSAVDETLSVPDWAAEEVTHQPRYYNLSLASHPFSRWSDAERNG